MIKYCLDKWNENQKILEDAIRSIGKDEMENYDYIDLFKLTITHILNQGQDVEYSWNVDQITEIDNGDYQGTLLYIIPRDTYQPTEYEYLMTYVGYGSCSGCDTLDRIQSNFWVDEYDEDDVKTKMFEEQIKEYMTLCKHLIENTIKPYNNGWREEEAFIEVELK